MFKSDRLCARRRFAVDQRQMNGTVGIGVSDRRAYAGIHNLKRDLLAAIWNNDVHRETCKIVVDVMADHIEACHKLHMAAISA